MEPAVSDRRSPVERRKVPFVLGQEGRQVARRDAGLAGISVARFAIDLTSAV
jgi:hypothetical protein